ncbi:MAG: hypothetical protein ABL908_06250 [Hyphomicrobium sp.]
MVQKPLLKSAERLFRARFPDYIDVRDAVAHAGDKLRTVDKYDEHAVVGTVEFGPMHFQDAQKTTITDSLNGRLFTNTWERRILSHEISAQSFNTLVQIKNKIWSAFAEAERITRERSYALRAASVQAKRDEPQP